MYCFTRDITFCYQGLFIDGDFEFYFVM